MKKYFASVFLVFLALVSNAQVHNLSIKFSGIRFRDFADTIKQKAGIRIFYQAAWVDSLYLDFDPATGSFEKILGKQLKKAGLSFVVKDDTTIIITKGSTVKTNFRQQYLDLLTMRYIKPDTSEYVPIPKAPADNTATSDYKIYRIGSPSAPNANGRVVLSGTIRDPDNGSPVIGAVVYAEKTKSGATTNKAGFYSLPLSQGQYRIEVSMVGMIPVMRNIMIYSDGVLNVDMRESTTQIDEVIIKPDRENQVNNLTLGTDKINVKMLRHILTGFGGSDLIKSSLLLPGVQSVGEASGGYNVRGGAADQNLVLLDGAPILNTSHFFGFFSAFNSDLISEATLYKSSIPAKFGGRLSSVMDIQPLEGNQERVRVSGGLSPVTGNLLVEGPVKKTKSSFAIGARTTYSDWILKLLPDVQLQNSSALFYDLQGHFNITLNEKNSISLSGYLSRDKFDYYRESAFDYGNSAATAKWKHAFSSGFSSQVSAIISNYKYRLDNLKDSADFSSMHYELDQYIFRDDFLYLLSEKHKIGFGVDATFYNLSPGIQEPLGRLSNIAPKALEKERGLDPSVYMSDEFEINRFVSVSGGLRATFFLTFGPGTEYVYAADNPLSVNNLTDTLHYSAGEIMSKYPSLDFMISSRLKLSADASVKIGFQRMHQNLHMISNTISISPTDIWRLSNKYIKPETGDQYSAGLFLNFPDLAFETSVEGYYKNLTNMLDYKGGAVLLMNEHLETDLVQGKGKAYGIELMAKKNGGSITGWINYTYSRTLMKVDSRFETEKVNGGNYFPATYDRPHDLKVVANAKLSRRMNFTSVFVFNTGRPITYPVEFFNLNNANRLFYSLRNEYRVPYYMRLDLSATLNGNLKLKKLNHSSFTFTVYNVLARKNIYSVYFEKQNGKIQGYQLSIFGQPVFMVTYNFKFHGNASDDF